MQKVIREPLFHFLILGGLIFLFHHYFNSNSNENTNGSILIQDSDIERLIKKYQQNWLKSPDEATLKKLLSDDIRTEIYYQAALKMNLNHNDEIIKRRLKQKYEFLIKDLVEPEKPSDEVLRQYYQTHQNNYLPPKQLSFQHIYFNQDRKNAQNTANQLLNTIRNKAIETLDFKKLGDDIHLPSQFNNKEESDIRQLFGEAFAIALFKNEKIGWTIPIKSGYGVHLVYISEIQESIDRVYDFDVVRNDVENDWKSEEMHKSNEQFYEALKQQYDIEYDLKKHAKIKVQ